MAYDAFWLLLIAGAAAWLFPAAWQWLRRRHVSRQPLSASAMQVIESSLPPWKKMPAELRDQLAGRIRQFLAEKNFEGCGGLIMTEEIRLTIAAQACLLLLNRKIRCYPKLETILVYPTAYRDKQKHLINTAERDERTKAGESWQSGNVVLAWDHVVAGVTNYADGHNVTFHEFAHQLDQDDGAADGTPVLPISSYATWARVFTREYETLTAEVRKGHRTVLDRYGTENPAEFFAVATEAFFEKPRQLQEKHPDLYHELQAYYCVDPLAWL